METLLTEWMINDNFYYRLATIKIPVSILM
jgi:hypothetical protein